MHVDEEHRKAARQNWQEQRNLGLFPIPHIRDAQYVSFAPLMRVNWLAKEETQRKQAAAIGDYNHIAGKQHKKNRASIFSECPPSARKFVVLKSTTNLKLVVLKY
jgi:hypothetical protein